MTWLGKPLLEASWSYFRICSWDWQFWRLGGSSLSIWPLSWTWAFSIHVKKNTSRREKYAYLPSPFFFFVHLFLLLASLFDFFFTEMATRYSKDKYARVKGMKNEPLSQLAIETKKHKLNRRKVRQPLLPSSVLSPLLQLRLSRWWHSRLPPLVPKGRVRFGKEFGRTQPQLSVGLIMWLLTRTLKGCLPSNLMSWSIVT